MARPTFEELRQRRLDTMSANERAEFDAALAVARLAMEVGEKVRDAREAAGLTQRDLAARMSTSQAAVARLEAGGTSATLRTLHKAAAAIDMTVTVDLNRDSHLSLEKLTVCRSCSGVVEVAHRPARHIAGSGQHVAG